MPTASAPRKWSTEVANWSAAETRAFSRAVLSPARVTLERSEMMDMTTMSSTSVNPFLTFGFFQSISLHAEGVLKNRHREPKTADGKEKENHICLQARADEPGGMAYEPLCHNRCFLRFLRHALKWKMPSGK